MAMRQKLCAAFVSDNQDRDIVGLWGACGKSLHALANRFRKFSYGLPLKILHDLPQARFFE
jgi:hypothetical protein